MESKKNFTRLDALIRFAMAIVCYIALCIVTRVLIGLTMLFQYGHLVITKDVSKPVLKFSNRLNHYSYRLMRYVTLCENQRPVPVWLLSDGIGNRASGQGHHLPIAHCVQRIVIPAKYQRMQAVPYFETAPAGLE